VLCSNQSNELSIGSSMEKHMTFYPWTSRILAASLAFLLCGAPEVMAQAAPQTQTAPAQQTTVPAAQSPDATAPAQTTTTSDDLPQGSDDQQNKRQQPQNSTLDVDPSKGPLQPVPSEQQNLPDEPTPQQPAPAQNAPAQTTPAAQQQQQPPVEPEGTAVAPAARTAGGAASKPAGTAIAPAKQRQVRSLLIKLGAIAGGAAALGIVYGLTRGTSSTPPNATAAGVTQAH
jgi:hypothetical protein